MESKPSDLPSELSYIVQAKNPQDLLNILIEHADDHVVKFLEIACLDDMWTARHLEYITPVLKWINEEFSAGRFNRPLAEKTLRLVQSHYSLLKSTIPWDIAFNVDGQEIKAYSLMYMLPSSFFFDLLQRVRKQIHSHTKFITLNLPNTTFKLLSDVNEFVHEGIVRKLATSNENEIIALQEQAKSWDLPDLSQLCSNVFKKYINSNNVINKLLQSHREWLIDLKSECLDFINYQQNDLNFSMNEQGQVSLEIVSLTSRGVALLKKIHPIIYHLECHGKLLVNDDLVQIVEWCTQLFSIDFSRSEHVNEALLSVLPPVQEITLVNCPWISYTTLQLIFARAPSVKNLNLADNMHMGFEEINALRSAPDLLILDLANFHGFDEIDTAELTEDCPLLRELTITDAQLLTDVAIQAIPIRCPDLIKLNFSDCQGLSDEGIVGMAMRAPNLISLALCRCRGVTEQVVSQILQLCTELRYLDIRQCPIDNKASINSLRRKYPYVDIQFS